jgi:hypothetical protein
LAEVRVVIGAAQRTPTWYEPRDKRRVLVEGPGASHWDSRRDFPDDSASVLACAGPTGRHLRCPALTGQVCPLAAGADLIVVSRPPATDEWNVVRAAHPRLHPGVPILVETGAAATLLAHERRVATEAERRSDSLAIMAPGS